MEDTTPPGDVVEEIVHYDENGVSYNLVKKTRKTPRHTYLKATLTGKYWGEINEIYSSNSEHSRFYDFNIYEVTLKDAVYSTTPFLLEEDLRIPRHKLPKHLPTILEKDGKEYEVNLNEPRFADIRFNRKLHQEDGDEVFGTIEATITGYILDFREETYYEKKHFASTTAPASSEPAQAPVVPLQKTSAPTGKVDYQRNYKRAKYFYSDYKSTYWDKWQYTKPPKPPIREGLFSAITGIMTLLVGIIFLLMMLPRLVFLLPFVAILLFLLAMPPGFFKWLSRILGGLLLIGFIIELSQSLGTRSSTYLPKPVMTERPEEQLWETVPVRDTINNQIVTDTLIKHFRTWSDYDGRQYEGTIWVRKSDFARANQFKNSLPLNPNTGQVYDEVIFRLKENDKDKLAGIYQLFDSIRLKEQPTNVQFAEMIVSFIQDIPYAVIVPKGCDPNLYEDKFVRQYLNLENARCDGFEKFGINTPVEFMASLNGDCDTRTLLLYTMLAHYGYDVALLSSEYYAHSLIGVNLPISGIDYQYHNQRYVLWETTAPNTRAGVLANEIANKNYWRISLKSQ